MKDILINVLFIVIFLLVTHWFVHWHKLSLQNRSTKLLLFIAGLILIVTSMTFSVSVNNSLIYDLRVIPTVIGGLLGGPIVAIALFVSMIAFRLIMSVDLGWLAAVINFGPLTLLIIACYKPFITGQFKRRVVILCFIILTHLVLDYLVLYTFFHSGLPVIVFTLTSIIKAAAIISIIFAAELISRYQNVRLQLDKLEKMQLVYHLSASISHEVRNGLTSVHGFLQLLQETSLDSKQKEYVQIGLQELMRTENIINDFLTFAKPTPKHTKDIQLDQLLATTLLLIKPFANMNSIHIQHHLQPITITGDEGMLQQALLNFFKNAIEAMPSGGTLTVEMQSQSDEVKLIIQDTGVGMEPDQIERLGTPYFTTKGQKGTGLGMMVAYRVIQQFKGRIEIESKSGVGTKFTIYFPITRLKKDRIIVL